MMEKIVAIVVVLLMSIALFLIRHLILNLGKKKKEYRHIDVRRVKTGGHNLKVIKKHDSSSLATAINKLANSESQTQARDIFR